MLRIGTPIPHKHARIEIIPLIDIMFFLLASFMMVSLQMSKTENVRVNLPSASQAKPDFRPDSVNIAVDELGKAYYQKTNVDPASLLLVMSNRFRLDTNTSVYISGDLNTPHGAMVVVYDVVRKAGVQKIAFCVTSEREASTSGTRP